MPPCTAAIHQTTPLHQLAPSPPIAPKVVRAEKTSFAPTRTLTKLGRLLSVNRTAKNPFPLTLDTLWTAQKKAKLKKCHKESLAMNGINIDAKKSDEFLKHCIKAATAIVIGPPTDPDWAEHQKYPLDLMFSTKIKSGTSCLLYWTVVISTFCRAKGLQPLVNTLPRRRVLLNPKNLSPSTSLHFCPPPPRIRTTGSALINRWHGSFSHCIHSASKMSPSPIPTFVGMHVEEKVTRPRQWLD